MVWNGQFNEYRNHLEKELRVRALRRLDHLRDLLLPKLITGKIRVRDAEKAVEAAL